MGKWLSEATIIAALIWLTCYAVFHTYFRAKEKFVERLVNKQKGTNNAQE